MNEYRTVEANGTSYILNEDMALRLCQAISKEFRWSGTFFTPEDVRTTIIHHHLVDDLDPPEGDELEELVSAVIDSADWEWVADWMVEEGWGVVNTAISERLEKESS